MNWGSGMLSRPSSSPTCPPTRSGTSLAQPGNFGVRGPLYLSASTCEISVSGMFSIRLESASESEVGKLREEPPPFTCKGNLCLSESWWFLRLQFQRRRAGYYKSCLSRTTILTYVHLTHTVSSRLHGGRSSQVTTKPGSLVVVPVREVQVWNNAPVHSQGQSLLLKQAQQSHARHAAVVATHGCATLIPAAQGGSV